MSATNLSCSKSTNMNFSIVFHIIFAICLFHINMKVNAWGYPEDDCYKCYDDDRFGKGGMYFCRHNSTGLTWG